MIKILKSVLTIFICFFIIQTALGHKTGSTPESNQGNKDSTAKILAGTSSRSNTTNSGATLDSAMVWGQNGDDAKKMIVENHNHYIKYGSSFISGCILILLIWFLKSRIQQREKRRQRQSNIGSDSNSRLRDEQMQSKMNGLKREKQEMQIRIDKLEDIKQKSIVTIDELNGKIDDLQAAQYVASEPAAISESEPLQNSSKYLYFPSPLSDGSFRKIDGKPQFLEGASIYRFSLISDTEAKFEFCDESSSVSMALNNRSDLILSVAEEMEGASAGAKKILTYKGMPGEALLEDNRWIVIHKAQIKYV